MRIQNNIMAMNAYRNYTVNTNAISGNLEKLSSGYKVNRAGDDAAGLAISEKMRAQITGLDVAQKNANDGISLVQTAEGALAEVHDMLNRMYELANQSANGTYDDDVDRANLNKEITALKDEINRIADSANFNGINLLDGTQAGPPATVTLGTGGTASVDDTTAGKVGTATTTVLDFSKITDIKSGQTITIEGTTFEFVGAGETAQTGNVSVAITEGDVDATLGTLQAAATTELAKTGADEAAMKTAGIASVAFASSKLTITSAVPAAGAAAVGVINPGEEAYAGAEVTSTLGGLTLQVGDTSASFNQLTVSIGDMHTDKLGLDSVDTLDSIDISNQLDASKATDIIKAAINQVSSTRGDLGAIQNRLDHTINNLSVMEENIQNAESAIRDTDVAEEMMAYTKNNILIQSAQAMLAQANQIPQGVLQLLG